jgi:hypothetical protein
MNGNLGNGKWKNPQQYCLRQFTWCLHYIVLVLDRLVLVWLMKQDDKTDQMTVSPRCSLHCYMRTLLISCVQGEMLF